MANVIDWLNANADFMNADLPEIWSRERAFEWLSDTMATMRGDCEDLGFGSWTTGEYTLNYSLDDGVESWELTRLISSATLLVDEFDEDFQSLVYSHTHGSEVLVTHCNLPDPADDNYFPEF